MEKRNGVFKKNLGEMLLHLLVVAAELLFRWRKVPGMGRSGGLAGRRAGDCIECDGFDVDDPPHEL